MSPDEGKNYVERIKLIFELNKHITTLASATVVVFVSFVGSYFLQHPNTPYAGFTWGVINVIFFVLILSIIVAVVNMFLCYGYLELPEKLSGRVLVIVMVLPFILYGLGLGFATFMVSGLFT
jgi:hypothetical protein